MKRSTFGSKFGMLAAAVGSAVGLGNIWKFPYLAGENERENSEHSDKDGGQHAKR